MVALADVPDGEAADGDALDADAGDDARDIDVDGAPQKAHLDGPLDPDAALVCPECGAQYRSGFTECSDCLVPLVEPEPEVTETASPGELSREPVDLVSVCTAANAAQAALVKATLESAGIRHLARGIGWAGLGSGFDFPGLAETGFGGPVEFQVRREDADEARELLDGLAYDR